MELLILLTFVFVAFVLSTKRYWLSCTANLIAWLCRTIRGAANTPITTLNISCSIDPKGMHSEVDKSSSCKKLFFHPAPSDLKIESLWAWPCSDHQCGWSFQIESWHALRLTLLTAGAASWWRSSTLEPEWSLNWDRFLAKHWLLTTASHTSIDP